MPNESELIKIKVIVEEMNKRLFGNGQQGLIEDLHDMHRANTARIEQVNEIFNRWKWILIGIFIGVSFLTSSGIISLKALLEATGAIAK